jgi:geranylgeranyl diphosphate synthase type II
MIRVSLRLGGIVGGAEEIRLAALDSYGQRLGLAFQIVDDLLDLQGNEEDLGKRAGKDLERGKLTFPAVLGAAESRRRAEELIAAATEAIRPLGAQAAGLEALARYVLERNN